MINKYSLLCIVLLLLVTQGSYAVREFRELEKKSLKACKSFGFSGTYPSPTDKIDAAYATPRIVMGQFKKPEEKSE